MSSSSNRQAAAGPERAIRNRYVDLPEGQVHVREVPGEQPALVFLHQTASSAGSFIPLMRALDLPNRLIAIDTPGFGGSFDPPGAPSLADYAHVVLATLEALDAGRVHLFGHHTGASLALVIADAAPDRVTSLMLAGPVFMTDTERADFLRGYREPIAPARDGSHLLTNWNYASQFNPDCDVVLLHDEVVSMLRAWRGRAQAYSAVGHGDDEATARRIRQPVLLLTSPDDFFHLTFDRAAALFPHAPRAVTAGGNFQPTADLAGVAGAIGDFLRTLAHPDR